MFVEEFYKDNTMKLEVKLARNNEALLTSWQISDFISQLTKHYYKNELLNTISLALKHGIPPKDIIIFEESFEINNAYSNINGLLDFTSYSDVKTFYHLGEPISMFPNEEVASIHSAFSHFRKTNEILGRYKFSRLSKNKLKLYYTMIREKTSHKEVITHMENLAKEIVREAGNPDTNRVLFHKNIENLTKYTLEKYSDYKKNFDSLEILASSLENNNFDILGQAKYRQLERQYFNAFFSKFESLKRPIVGIFYSDTQKVQIFCQSFMNKTKHDPSRFLDLKSISHNSPYEAIFTLGVPIVVSLIGVLNVALNTRSLGKESEDSITERREAEIRVAQTIERLESLTEIEEVKSVEEIPQQYIKRHVKEIRELNTRKFQEPIEKYGFVNSNIEVTVVDSSPTKQYTEVPF